MTKGKMQTGKGVRLESPSRRVEADQRRQRDLWRADRERQRELRAFRAGAATDPAVPQDYQSPDVLAGLAVASALPMKRRH